MDKAQDDWSVSTAEKEKVAKTTKGSEHFGMTSSINYL